MHNFDVPHASKTVNHAPTESEVHIKRTTYDGPFPPLNRILYAPAVICTTQKNHT